MGIYIKGIIIVVLILLPNVLFYIFPTQTAVPNLKSPPMLLTIIEQIGRMACLIVPIVLGKQIAEQRMSIFVILMGVCLIIYYVSWWMYFTHGREFVDLFSPLGFIPVPMAVFPSLYFLLLGVWLRSPYMIATATVFAIAHITISWNTYVQLLRTK